MGSGAGGSGRGGGGGGGQRSFAQMTPQELVAEVSGGRLVTDVGQFTDQQRAALRAAVRRGQLVRYPSMWGGNRTFGPPGATVAF